MQTAANTSAGNVASIATAANTIAADAKTYASIGSRSATAAKLLQQQLIMQLFFLHENVF